jgi:HlyD family secretion protein
LLGTSEAGSPSVTTTVPELRDIIHKVVAAGAIVPRHAVTIKPRVSGIVERIAVRAGQPVKVGDLIAQIKIVPNVVELDDAEARLRVARLRLQNTRQVFERSLKLSGEGVLSESDLQRNKHDVDLAVEELAAAQSHLELVVVGGIRGSGKVSNLVESTVAGTVIDVPAKEGGSVIETNNFFEGTTLATVADMNDMIFRGHVDEGDVAGLEEGVPVRIKVGALDHGGFAGTLESIAPQGTEKEGTIEFEVRANLELPEDTSLRANYSATADIILARRERALSIEETVLMFDDAVPYVEVEVAPRRFEKRIVTLGLSDSIYVEVLDGLAGSERVKVPSGQPSGPS